MGEVKEGKIRRKGRRKFKKETLVVEGRERE